ncbi:hypothetical protein MKW92_040989, partial [Papaver armeniacum]
MRNGQQQQSDGRSGGGGGNGRGEGDKIDALGRLFGYLLELDLKTFANIPLNSHTIDDIREAVRKDNKQRFGLSEENGELLIRANQGHSIKTIESENLLKPITSAVEAP